MRNRHSIQFKNLHLTLNALPSGQAERLQISHNRVRSATKAGRAQVKAQTPDLLGLYVLVATTLVRKRP